MRLYRGEAPRAETPEWVKSDPYFQDIQKNVAGRWFTSDAAQGEWHAGEAGTVKSVDVPADQAAQAAARNNPEALAHATDPENDYFVFTRSILFLDGRAASNRYRDDPLDPVA